MPKYQLTNHQISSTLANETVILNHNDGIYYGLNEVGTFIWEQLKAKASSLEEIKIAVLDEFDIDENTAKSDINDILNELLNEKLVEII